MTYPIGYIEAVSESSQHRVFTNRIFCGQIQWRSEVFDMYVKLKYTTFPAQCGAIYIAEPKILWNAGLRVTNNVGGIVREYTSDALRANADPIRIRDLSAVIENKLGAILMKPEVRKLLWTNALKAMHAAYSGYCTLVFSDTHFRTEQAWWTPGAMGKLLELDALPWAINNNSHNEIRFFASFREKASQLNTVPLINLDEFMEEPKSNDTQASLEARST